MSSVPEACSHVEPELVAYLGGELPEADAERIARHVEECPECAAALEEFRRTYALVRTIPMIEPSAAFRAGLERRISEKVASRAAAPGAPAAPAAPGGPGGRISKRLAAIEAARARGGGWAVYVSVSMAAVCAFLFVTQFIIFERRARREVYIGGLQAKRLLGELKQRRECPARYETHLVDGRVDFSPVVRNGTVRLVGYRETAAPSDRCVFAYDPIQWEDLAFRAERADGDERDRLQGLIEDAMVAEVVSGTLEIPPGLLAESLLQETELTVLPLRRRAEIWATRALRDYLSRDFIFNIKIEREAMEIMLFTPGIRTS